MFRTILPHRTLFSKRSNGRSESQAAAAVGAAWKARELAKAARRMDNVALGRAFQVLCETDITLKGGKCPSKFALEAAVIALTS